MAFAAIMGSDHKVAPFHPRSQSSAAVTHPYHLVVKGPPPRPPIALYLCLLLAGLPATATAAPGDAAPPDTIERPLIASSSDEPTVADAAIFAWELQPLPGPSSGSGEDGGDALAPQSATAGGDAALTGDELIHRIINGGGDPPSAFWDTNKAWAGLLPARAEIMDWSGINRGGSKDGKSDDTPAGPAAAAAGKLSAAVVALDQAPSQGFIIAFFCVALVSALAALLAYCAVVSCVSTTRGKLRPATPNSPVN